MSKFEINSSRLFLTYPQCSITKEDAYIQLFDKFNPEEIIVAHELHANGDPHLHCYLKLFKPYRTTNSKFADLGTYHGNYQGCRSAKNVIKYCTKAEDYHANFDVAALLDKKSTRRSDMESIATGKRSLSDLIHESPQYLMGYTKLKIDLNNFLQDTKAPKPPLPYFLPNPWGYVITTCTNRKLCHLWIHGPPNAGKSFLFARPLLEQFDGHLKTGKEPYWNLSGTERFIILDEYNHATYRWNELNAMADGTFDYRRFHNGVVRLNRPIIIVLSNLSLSTIYPYMHETLFARFKEYDLN